MDKNIGFLKSRLQQNSISGFLKSRLQQNNIFFTFGGGGMGGRSFMDEMFEPNAASKVQKMRNQSLTVFSHSEISQIP